MYKRLLALLVFLPMFLLAWYARSHRPPGEAPAETRVAERGSSRPATNERSRGNSREERRGSREERQGSREGGGADDQVGRFDFYLLTLSWSPEFCATHPGKPECAAAPGFVLHGLWPQNNDGTYPQHCSDAPGPQDTAALRDLFPDAGLLEHEWETHGTCSGLSPDTYLPRPVPR